MTTLLLSHADCIAHEPPGGHPERPDRLRAVNKVLEADLFDDLKREDAPMGEIEHVRLVHPQEYVDMIRAAAPDGDMATQLDPDTYMSQGSWNATMRAVGAGVRAVDEVLNDNVENAFCAVRPPGHHAETARAMGFCLFSSVAIAAHYARATYDLERVAVVDFDVHHGNGTQEIFWADKNLFYASTHQMPLFPGTGHRSETGVGNIFNAPLNAGDGGSRFKQAMTEVVFPALKAFKPDLLIISAGFDAHRDDPLAMLELTEEDFGWATLQLMDIADVLCEGRVVSMLEGGYDLNGLARSVAVHVKALMEA